jgi:hypothetical protein
MNTMLKSIRVVAITSVLLCSGVMQSQQSDLQLEVEAADQAAASSISHFWYRVLPANTKAARSVPRTILSNKQPRSLPAVPNPGFYPADVTFHGGKIVQNAEQHLVYFDCSIGPSKCWGNPARFLEDLSKSAFVHLVDQYVGTNTSHRYPVGTSVSINQPLQTFVLGQNDILAIVHAAAAKLGLKGGYTDIVHVFLPEDVDTCIDLTNICYSPDSPPSFVFCAYHGSVDFSDIGHVLYSVEPFQDVSGCQVSSPSPNGQLVDSTASVLSHETFEVITDPDGDAWWADKTLNEQFAEIADICEPFATSAPVLIVNGKKYKLQLEYSNKYHACTHGL